MTTRLTPVPDLAAGPWQISEDGLTWTIKLKDNAYFQPTGEQLTAQDVVFTYQLANSANCRFNPDTCLGFVTVTPEGATEPVNVLQDVKAIDDFTVEFTLADKYAPFATTASTLQINSKKAVEEAFAAFQEQTADVNAADVDALLAAIAAEKEANAESETGPDLAQFQAEAEALMAAADLPLPDQANFAAEDGSLDATAYVEALEVELPNLSLVLSSSGDRPDRGRLPAAQHLTGTRRHRPLLRDRVPPRPGHHGQAQRPLSLGSACLRHALHAHHQGRCGSFVRAGRWRHRLEVLADRGRLRAAGRRCRPQVRPLPGLRLLRPHVQPAP